VEGAFSAHSLRSGFVTEAGRQQIPLAETMAMTGHRSVQTVIAKHRPRPRWHPGWLVPGRAPQSAFDKSLRKQRLPV
jgi:lysine/ornithine N-monooxygenase